MGQPAVKPLLWREQKKAFINLPEDQTWVYDNDNWNDYLSKTPADPLYMDPPPPSPVEHYDHDDRARLECLICRQLPLIPRFRHFYSLIASDDVRYDVNETTSFYPTFVALKDMVIPTSAGLPLLAQ